MVREPDFYDPNLKFSLCISHRLVNNQSVYVDNPEPIQCPTGANVLEQDQAKCLARKAFQELYPNLSVDMSGIGWSGDVLNCSGFRIPDGIIHPPFDYAKLQRLYNEAHGLTGTTPTEPVTVKEWLDFAKVKLVTENESSLIAGDLQTLRQIEEEYARNDISDIQAINLIQQVLLNTGTLTREDIEAISKRTQQQESLLPGLQNNLNILFGQLETLISRAQRLVNDIQSGNFSDVDTLDIQDSNQLGGLETRTLEQIYKDTLEGIITESIPRNIQNIKNQFDQARQEGLIDMLQTEQNRFSELELQVNNLTTTGAAIIDQSPGLAKIAGIDINDIKEVVV